MQLSGKTILITGGASGLGGAVVDMVVAQGARAVVIDLNEAAGRSKEGAHRDAVRFVKGDVTVEADVQRAVTMAVDTGGLYGVVNAAGIPAAGQDGAGAAVEQGMLDTVFGEQFGCTIEGVALADAAEVELDT